MSAYLPGGGALTDGLFALCKPPLVVDVVADASAMAPSESFFDVDYVRGRLALVS